MKDLALVALGWRDWSFCRTLASEPFVRASSIDQRLPTFTGHARWMARHMYLHGRAGFVAVWRGGLERCGVLTLRGSGRWLEMGVVVPRALHGMGLGSAIIRLGCGEAVRLWGADVRVVAVIKEDNVASLRAFTKARFRVSEETGPPAAGYKEFLWTL